MGVVDPSIAKHLETLGVSERASIKEAKQAHRDLAAVWHPDRFSDNPRLQDKATEKLKEINVAYEALVKYHETHGGFIIPAAGTAGGREETPVTEPGPEEDVAEETPGEEEISGSSWGARHMVFLSVLIALCLVGIVFMIQTRKRIDFKNVPHSQPPYQATVAESGPPAGKAAAKPPSPEKIAPVKERTVPAPKAAVAGKYITLGSSKEQVLAALGPPPQSSENRWVYGSSYVEFTKGLVTGWSNSSLNPLNVRLAPSRETSGESFTLGSSRDQVSAVQGTPTQVSKNRWSYGFSYVDFEKGKVKSWYSSRMDPLNVVMTPAREPDQEYFTVGSSKEEVLALQGTPTRLTETRWGYGYSYVDFEKGKVVKWYNSERDPLKVQEE